MGPFKVRFARFPISFPAWACDFTTADGRRFTFGADCAPNDAIVELARGTDLLMLEATEGPEPRQHHPVPCMVICPPARRANSDGVRMRHGCCSRTIRTSSMPIPCVLPAEAAFGRPVALAVEGASYEL